MIEKREPMKPEKAIRFVTAFIAAFVLCTIVAFAQKAYTLDELDQFIKVERISERVLVIRMGHANFTETVTAIATQKGIVVIDAGMNPSVSEKYRKIIEQEFKRTDFVYVINTHADMDHTFGDRIFPEAKIVGHNIMKRELVTRWGDAANRPTFAEYVNQWNENLTKVGENSDEGKQLKILISRVKYMILDFKSSFVLPLPAITFNDKMTLNMGDITFHLYYFGKAHRESDILIYVPQEKILFVGDLFGATGQVAFDQYNHENVERWSTTLNEILKSENGIEYVVNGHNGSTMGKDVLLVFNNDVQKIRNELSHESMK